MEISVTAGHAIVPDSLLLPNILRNHTRTMEFRSKSAVKLKRGMCAAYC